MCGVVLMMHYEEQENNFFYAHNLNNKSYGHEPIALLGIMQRKPTEQVDQDVMLRNY